MVLALVQARAGGTRLPGKVMRPLAGKPMVEHIVRRTKAADMVDHVCVCIPDTTDNDVLAEHLAGLEYDVYRGSEDDVLARFYWATERYPDTALVVRITADDPFKDPTLIDYAVNAYLSGWHGEAHPTLGVPQIVHLGGETWPLGLDVEVFSRDALVSAHRLARKPEEREHVTTWMQRHFHVWVVRDEPPRGHSGMRWTVDTEEDYRFACWVYDLLYEQSPLFGYDDMLAAGVLGER